MRGYNWRGEQDDVDDGQPRIKLVCMAKIIFVLDQEDVSQLLRDLGQKMDSYNHTAAIMDDEDPNLEHVLIEDVQNSDEARAIAGKYRRIIDEMSQQIS